MSKGKYLNYLFLQTAYSKIGVVVLSFSIALFGCVKVPPQVAKTHQKELEIIESLKSSHMAMVDAYIDKKLQNFEQFFFNEYGPVFLKNWTELFNTINNRDYDQSKDFPLLYNDLVAEYQIESQPIENIRLELKKAISTEYRNAIDAHNSVGRWLDNLEKLNEAQRSAINSFLSAIKPGFSLDSIDNAVETAKNKIEKKIEELK